MPKSFLKKTLLYALLLIALALLLFPFAVMISTAFKSLREVYAPNPHWIPYIFQFRNFVEIFGKIPLLNFFINSLIIASGTTFLCVALSLPAAYATARLRFKGRKFLLYLFLTIQMFSPVVIVISLFKIVAGLGLLDSFVSLIVVNTVFTLAFTIWMMNGYFRTIPLEIEEAAMIDGCSRFQALRKVMLPIAVPGITTVIIYCFTTAWNEFMFAMTFINSFEKRPITVGLFDFVGRWTVDWHYLMAASILATLPVVILFLFIEKQLVEGLAAGAVKG
jgi:multiple sugar transport system permease protein